MLLVPLYHPICDVGFPRRLFPAASDEAYRPQFHEVRIRMLIGANCGFGVSWRPWLRCRFARAICAKSHLGKTIDVFR